MSAPGTGAYESGGNLDLLVARTPALGQALSASSRPVVIASDQGLVPVRLECVNRVANGQLYFGTTGQMSSASSTTDAPLSIFNPSSSGKNVLIFDITISSGTGSIIGMLYATTTDPAYASAAKIQNASLGGAASAIASHVTFINTNQSIPGSGALRHIYGQYTISVIPNNGCILLPSGSNNGITAFLESYSTGIGGISMIWAEY